NLTPAGVSKLSDEQLKGAAKLGAIVGTEVESAVKAEIQKRAAQVARDIEIRPLTKEDVPGLKDDRLQDIRAAEFASYDRQTQQAIYKELQQRGLTPKWAGGPTRGNLPLNQEQLVATVQKLSDKNLTTLAGKLANEPNPDKALQAAVQNEIARRGG